MNDEELAYGLRSIAAPIHSHSGDVIAALNLAVHRTMVSMDELIAHYGPAVKQTAHDITLNMGHRLAAPERPTEGRPQRRASTERDSSAPRLPMSGRPTASKAPCSGARRRTSASTTEIGRYLGWLERERGLVFEGWDDLWRWSVDDLQGFWSSIWEFFEVKAHTPYEAVLADEAMPGATWFPGARLNFAEHLVGRDEDADEVAILSRSQTRGPVELTYAELREQVARARAGLARLGVGPGDRVAAFMPNIPETLVAFAATVSLGAVWASCAPELGPRSVIDRLAQLEPTVLLTVGGYGFRDRLVDRRDEVAAIRAALPTLHHVVHVPYGGFVIEDAVPWDELLADPGPLEFLPVAFDHPLFVLFSSGTTGPPKAIVHGHGGILLELLKAHAFSWDLKPGGRLLWFSTTSWMMWNALVAALLVRSSIVMLDGDPMWPDIGWQWRVAEESRPSFMGVSPTFLMACRKAGLTTRARARSQLDPRLRHRRLAASRRGLPLRLRRARARRAADQRQRRNRRLQRDRRRLASASRSTRARSRGACSASRQTPSTSTASRSSASSGSS